LSLLTLIQTAANLLGIPSPSMVVGSTDAQVQQLLALANEEGLELAQSHNWQALKRQYTFLSVADEEQIDALPGDVNYFIDNTFFDRTTRRELLGPITPQIWQAIMAQPQLNRVFLAWRMRNGEFLITPTPSANDTIAYEYMSTYWVEAANGDPKTEFTADTDLTVLPERLHWLGVRWRFLKSKNLDYAEDFRTYETAKQMAQARDGGATRLNITGRDRFNPYGFPNIPLGNFPPG
jgi:hypothetical protein